MTFNELYEKSKESWIATDSYRKLKTPTGIDFCSNDYLGLSASQELNQRIVERMKILGLGSTGSRLLCGQSHLTEKLEEELAEFSGMDRSLFFSSGYQANLALFSSLLKNEAVVFSDERIHASIIDGIRLSRCEKYIWSHNDLEHLRMLLKQKVDPRRLNIVVVESIYSMTGHFAPLPELVEICEEMGAYLIVDEAHATGLYGHGGSGLCDHYKLNDRIFAKIHTAGKALGVSGAWIAGADSLIDLVVNTARPFIYSTAPAQYQQVACEEAMQWVTKNFQTLQATFQERVLGFQNFLKQRLVSTQFSASGWGSPVTAWVLGENKKALSAMNYLSEKGFEVRAIRPPSVPINESLLRITVPLNRTETEVTDFQKAIELCLLELET